MATIDRVGSRLSFFGRVTDDFRREPVWQGEYRVTLKSPPTEALYKQDGHFTFSDLPSLPTAYDFRLLDGLYQGRQFAKGLPTTAPVEITYDGEDEIYVFTKTVTAANKQITFDAIPFLPIIRRGAVVLGEGGFSTTLAEDLAGVDATIAVLTSVAGLTAGKLVRIVRSHCLRGKAGPYYPFPGGTTVLLLSVVEDSTDEPPLPGAKAHLAQVNGIAPSSTTVGGVVLRHLTLGGAPVQQPVLGTDADLDAFTEARGKAVFYYPGFWLLTSLQLAVSNAGYLTQTSVFPLTHGQTTSAKVKLVPI
jgi:hypothetical protein